MTICTSWCHPVVYIGHFDTLSINWSFLPSDVSHPKVQFFSCYPKSPIYIGQLYPFMSPISVWQGDVFVAISCSVFANGSCLLWFSAICLLLDNEFVGYNLLKCVNTGWCVNVPWTAAMSLLLGRVFFCCDFFGCVCDRVMCSIVVISLCTFVTGRNVYVLWIPAMLLLLGYVVIYCDLLECVCDGVMCSSVVIFLNVFVTGWYVHLL